MCSNFQRLCIKTSSTGTIFSMRFFYSVYIKWQNKDTRVCPFELSYLHFDFFECLFVRLRKGHLWKLWIIQNPSKHDIHSNCHWRSPEGQLVYICGCISIIVSRVQWDLCLRRKGASASVTLNARWDFRWNYFRTDTYRRRWSFITIASSRIRHTYEK